MKYLEVLQKAQKVYRSCESIEQLDVAKNYVMLCVKTWAVKEECLISASPAKYVAIRNKGRKLVKYAESLRNIRKQQLVDQL